MNIAQPFPQFLRISSNVSRKLKEIIEICMYWRYNLAHRIVIVLKKTVPVLVKNSYIKKRRRFMWAIPALVQAARRMFLVLYISRANMTFAFR
jgi:hypothetical protein